jgi:hypothetical protein
MSPQQLVDILDLTIKHDRENKLAAFLCHLSAYTDSSQFNVMFNAPSSSGKSYIPTQIASLFPPEDVMELGHCTPTAFFHSGLVHDKELNKYIVDLSRKIIIFLDQPHTELLTRIRPILSHDKKEIVVKITDKTEKGGMRTKDVTVRGFPSVIFCTANVRLDEQEATRFLMLSPDISQTKVRDGVRNTITRESDPEAYSNLLNSHVERASLKERIVAIRNANISKISIAPNLVKQVGQIFISESKKSRPRHMRDVKRLLGLVQTFALLNWQWRDLKDCSITANEEDVRAAIELWEIISESQELNLPPYVLDIYKLVVVKACEAKNGGSFASFDPSNAFLGITRQEALDVHRVAFGEVLDMAKFRQQIIPMLESANLIIQEPDPADRRSMLIYPASMYQFRKPTIPADQIPF